MIKEMTAAMHGAYDRSYGMTENFFWSQLIIIELFEAQIK